MSESKNKENKKTRENSEVDSDHTVKTSDMQTHMMRSVLKVRYERCSELLLKTINQAMS